MIVWLGQSSFLPLNMGRERRVTATTFSKGKSIAAPETGNLLLVECPCRQARRLPAGAYQGIRGFGQNRRGFDQYC
jgi:hypothetical protein